MLKALRVRNYVLIDSLDITFPEGLVIITGQTGAGKSILLGALSLLLGSKADSSMIGSSADNCVVEAEFDSVGDEVSGILSENDIEQDEGGLLIRRVVSRSGRSRSFVNDCPAGIQVLQQLSSCLVDIHSQHQNLLLTDHRYQLLLLDRFADNSVLLEKCACAFDRMETLRRELTETEAEISRAERDREYNETLFRQLDSAALKEGELEELEAEHEELANAEEIKDLLCQIESMVDGPQEIERSLTDSLKEMSRLMTKVSRFIPSMDSLSGRIDACRYELEDVFSEIASKNSSMDVSGERLEKVEERMSLIYSLLKRHGCDTVSDLIAMKEKYSSFIENTEHLAERRDACLDEMKDREREYGNLCAELSSRRMASASRFAAEITESIRALELPYAVFDVQLVRTQPGRTGLDTVTFLFSATGSNPVDVSRCASGGEMSRIMLCLKDMMARFSDMPTMVFDEIDTGVSGSVADKMGSMICSMGRNMQVFAITHLPQVAAKGNAHYLVSKSIDPDSAAAVTKIEKLSDERRVLELARMLSGSSLTEAAIANAKSLLQLSD